MNNIQKKLRKFANANLSGEGANELRSALNEAIEVLAAKEDKLLDDAFSSELVEYLREGNEDFKVLRELRQALLMEQSEQSRNQIKGAALQLATALKKGRELNVLAGLILVSIAASINDVSLLPRAKAVAKVGGGDSE